MNGIIPDAFRLGPATLRVSDAEQALDFYVNKIGLSLHARDDKRAVLGAALEDLLILEFHPGLTPRDPRESGLYHVAIRLGGRVALGAVIARLAAHRVKLGAADHLVSEAIYLWDPDNNGIEIYRDRPREEWHWADGQVQMSNRPLDYQGLLAQRDVARLAQQPLGDGTIIGHIHLQVDDLARAREFYVDVVGFAPVSTFPGAQFVSAGGYHHHLAMNIWDSRNGPLPSPDKAGLSQMTFLLPDRASAEALRARLQAAGTDTVEAGDGFDFSDPWRTKVAVRLQG